MLNVIPDPEACTWLYVPTLLVTFKVKLLLDVPPNEVGIVIVSPDVYELPGFVIVTVE